MPELAAFEEVGDAISVSVSAHKSAAERLSFSFEVTGVLSWPVFNEDLSRGTALYEGTCCELFLAGEQSAYEEWNFSPSGQWDYFQFSEYRALRHTEPLGLPTLSACVKEGAWQLRGEVPCAPQLRLIGASAIIKLDGDEKYHFALRHCATQPDFHLRESFVMSL